MASSEDHQGAIPVSSLVESAALPFAEMAAAIDVLPPDVARVVDGLPVFSEAAAAAYRRVVETDFSATAWRMDDEEDLKTVAMWVGLGGSFIADFAAAPGDPRIFAWVVSPVPSAAQFTLKHLKGRDGRWVPTSLLASEEQFLTWLDPDRQAVNPAAVTSILDCGPVGFRFSARDGILPSYFMLREFGGYVAQAILPGRSPDWSRWLELFTQHAGHRYAGITSANFSGLGREVRSGGTHKDLAEVQADMGYLGVPILSGRITLDGQELAPDDRARGYKVLNAPYLDLDERQRQQSPAIAPLSTSLLGFTSDAARWELLRHGSVHESALASRLAEHSVALENCAEGRLELSRYVGDLVAAFPLFSELESRQIAEISQLIEMVPFQRDEVIVEQGEKAEKMFFIATGAVVADVGGGIVLEAGNFFGEISLIERVPRTATVRGHEPGVLLALDGHIMHRLMEFLPHLAETVHEMARERLSCNIRAVEA